jgi:arginase
VGNFVVIDAPSDLVSLLRRLLALSGAAGFDPDPDPDQDGRQAELVTDILERSLR